MRTELSEATKQLLEEMYAGLMVQIKALPVLEQQEFVKQLTERLKTDRFSSKFTEE